MKSNLENLYNQKYFLLYGGQGEPYINEIQGLYHSNKEIGPFFEETFKIVSNFIDSLSRENYDEVYQHGFYLEKWLKKPETVPPDSYLKEPMLSVPIMFVTQVGHYLRFVKQIDGIEKLSNIIGSTGHSLGIFPAVLSSLASDEESIYKIYPILLKIVLSLGYNAKISFPILSLHPSVSGKYKSNELPSYMASVSKISFPELQSMVDKFNKDKAEESEKVFVGLRNTEKVVVLSGIPERLIDFRNLFSLKGRMSFLSVGAPFHSPLVKDIVQMTKESLNEKFSQITGKDLKFPVYDISDGSNLQDKENIIQEMLDMAVWKPVYWKKPLSPLIHFKEEAIILSFGCGSSVDKMSSSYLKANSFVFQNLTSQENLDSFLAQEKIIFPKKWEDYKPKVIKLPNKKKFLLNRFSYFTKKSPVLGGGMTPTTVETDIVVSAANKGFIVEWAGGGQVTEKMFFDRLDNIKRDIEPGASIIFNMLFLDAYLWNLQYPLIKKAKKLGYPIDGVTISAGIPDLKEAVRILNDLKEADLWMNAFKPGTIAQINQVINIAKEISNQNIIMHVEGGAAGGHHSWENLENLIKQTYSNIRQMNNLILAVGGGISNPEQAASWLLGTWDTEFCMPVDAVFLGTRLMAAKESKTSAKIKEDLVQLRGGLNWIDTKEGKDVGGIVSGRSGLGADIHYANTRWAKLSKYAESLVKGKDDSSAKETVLKYKQELIEKINQTTKPYFGDIDSMTYRQVLERLVYLFAPGERLQLNEGKWPDHPFIDQSYRSRLAKIIWRFEGRVCELQHKESPSVLNELSELQEPEKVLNKFFEKYSDHVEQYLFPEDVYFFKEICTQPGKPINFIPFIDENIVKWIRSDSLWYSHCKDIDGESCAWIPGPIGVSGIEKSNEPVFEILQNFETNIINKLEPAEEADYSVFFSNSRESIEKIESSVQIEKTENKIKVHVRENITVEIQEWAAFLFHKIGIHKNIFFLLNSNFITLDKEQKKNDISLFFMPVKDNIFEFQIKSKNLLVYEKEKQKASLKVEDDHILFSLVYPFPSKKSQTVPYLRKVYVSDTFNVFIKEKYDEKLNYIKNFYSTIWDIKRESGKIELGSNFTSTFKVEKERVYEFKKSTLDLYRDDINNEKIQPSVNMSIVYSWQSMMKSLFLDEIKGNIFNLLHLYHKFDWSKTNSQIKIGDNLRTESKIIGIEISPNKSAKKVQVGGRILKDKEIVCDFETAFLIRGDFKEDSLVLYKSETQKEYHIKLQTQTQIDFVSEIGWLKINKKSLQINDTLTFLISKNQEKKVDKNHQFSIEGKIFKGKNEIGSLSFSSQSSSIQQNPWQAFLLIMDFGDFPQKLKNKYCVLSESLQTPKFMDFYSVASGDFNPIHTNEAFALLAGLKQPIIHGMWTSSQALNICIQKILKGKSEKIQFLISNFEKPVFCDETLYVNVYHHSVNQGRMILDIEILNKNSERVYSGELILKSFKTAYIFTGQGSQSQGMGMNFYSEYSEAKKVWDRAEEMTQKMGFSILKIVRDNPTSYAMEDKVWYHPKGVLNLTQFTQVALVTKSIADWEVLKKKSLISSDCMYAGHSLGEFSSLACTGIISIEEVTQIVYQRGLAMQHFVPRDKEGKSPFGMSVILGNRHVGLNEAKILEIVDEVKEETKLHLEVVNYNIKDKQYSVTGHLEALEKMEQKLRTLLRGKRTFIRLAGIDVPFHSALLVEGVGNFRKSLKEKIHNKIDFSILDNRYIPNLVAVPFSIERNFIELVYKTSKSEILKNVLGSYDEEIKNPNHLRRILLIELLSFQFAKPVQWIKTQEYFIHDFQVEKVIDIGARGDLAGMMRQTVRDIPDSELSIWHIEENKNQVFYELEGTESLDIKTKLVKKTSKKEPAEQKNDNSVISSEILPQKEEATINIQSSAPQESLTDVPLNQTDSLKYILALKAEIRTDEIQDTDTIEKILGGNSSKRNQVLADIGAEFNTNSLDGAQDKSIGDLSKILSDVPYKKPGPYLKLSFEEFIKNYTPSDFSRKEIFSYLKEERMLPDGHLFSVCNLIPVLVRGGNSTLEGKLSSIGLQKRFSNANECKKWLDKAVDEYGKHIGISIPSKSKSAIGR